MNKQEFSLEFDILYNNINSNSAPAIDEYEKSVFLTKAQDEIVTTIYEGSFENSERLRECLDALVVTELLNSQNATTNNSIQISPYSKFFKLSYSPIAIVYEALILNGENCDNETHVLVKPATHDEYYRMSRNPFRRARKTEALRLNVKNSENIEIVYPSNVNYDYQVRYVKKPYPIILFEGDSNYDGLTVDGKDQSVNRTDINDVCELPEIVHRLIIDRAVQLASVAYKS